MQVHAQRRNPYLAWKLTRVHPAPDASPAAGQALGSAYALLQPAATSSATTMGLTPGTVSARGTRTAYIEETSVFDTNWVRMLMNRITMTANITGLTPAITGVMVWVIHAVTPQVSSPKIKAIWSK